MKKIRIVLFGLLILAVLAACTKTPTPTGKVVFKSADIEDNNLYLLDLATDELTIVDEYVSSANPVWSPDGSKLLYQSDEMDRFPNVVLMNADGSGRQFLTDNQTEYSNTSYLYTWSPDGKFIYLALAKASNEMIENFELSDFTRFNSDGTDPQTVEVFPMAWTPDNEWMVGYGVVDNNVEIMLSNIDGSEINNLSNDSTTADLSPQLSPDGSMVMFSSNGYLTQTLYVVNLDGSGLHRITQEEITNIWDAVWAPDGKMIYFSATTSDHHDIFSVAVDSWETVNLTNSDVSEYALELTSDGKILLMGVNNSDGSEIWAMDVDGTSRRLLVGEAHSLITGISSDQHWLVFTSLEDEFWKVNLLSLDDLTTILPLSESLGDISVQSVVWQP